MEHDPIGSILDEDGIPDLGPMESGFILVDSADEDVDQVDDEKDADGRAGDT